MGGIDTRSQATSGTRAGTHLDPVARAASEVAGGPPGRYAAVAAHARGQVAAVLTALAGIPIVFGVLLRIPCIKTAWGNDGQFWNACYSDLANAYRTDHLADGLGAYLSSSGSAPTTGHPPVTGFLLALVSSLVPDGSRADQNASTVWFFSIWTALLAVLFVLTVLLVVASAPNPWQAALVACSPVAALTLFVSADLVGVFLAAVGMWLWGRSRPAAAGVALGLAISARSYPVLILVAIVLLCARTGRLPDAARTAGATLVTIGLIMVALLALNPRAAASAYTGWWSGGAGYGSPWLLLQYAGITMPPTALSALAALGWVVAVLAGAALALGSRRRPSLAEVSLVMVGIVLITGKSFTVQSSLWLVPLVAWAGMAWRDKLIWSLAEAVHFVAVWLVIGQTVQADRALPNSWYSAFLMLRVLAVLWVVAQTWMTARDRWLSGPAPDGDRDVDGLSGTLTDAPDELIVRLR